MFLQIHNDDKILDDVNKLPYNRNSLKLPVINIFHFRATVVWKYVAVNGFSSSYLHLDHLSNELQFFVIVLIGNVFIITQKKKYFFHIVIANLCNIKIKSILRFVNKYS